MKQLFTLLIFCLLGAQAKAQSVDLPDYDYLKGECIRYDSVKKTYQIDITCANTIISEKLMISNRGSLSSLLEYYKNLDSLQINYGDDNLGATLQIDFNNFSQKLKSLGISAYGSFYEPPFPHGKLIIKNLPNSIKYLESYTETFGELEIDKWPDSLTNLLIGESAVNSFSISKAFPETLEGLTLFVSMKDISLIKLPVNLKKLYLSSLDFDFNRLKSLTLLKEATLYTAYSNLSKKVNLDLSLPNLIKLEIMGYDRNYTSEYGPDLDIVKLPENIQSLSIGGYTFNDIVIPESLRELSLSNMKTVSSDVIKRLPNHIEKLYLDDVKGLDDIEKFPTQLKSLYLNSISISTLPDFPESLDSLNLSFLDELQCLPIFPENLKYFEGNYLGKVKCIPNETPYVKATTKWPVCTDEQYICNAEELTTVTGTVFYDLNNNGVKDAGDIPVYGGILSLNEETFATSNTEGIYKLILREQGTFEVKASSNHPYYISSIPAVKTIVYDENYDNDSVHFLIQIEDVKDLKISGTNLVARPGMNTSITAFVENFGVNDLSDVTVKIKKPQDWNLIQARPSGYREDNDTLIWENINLNKLSVLSFNIQTKLPATATILGNSYQYEMWVSSVGHEDVTPENNYYSIIDTIIGSYDPNDKVVNHTSLTPENSNSQELIYTIRFQNTGTDTAFKVVVIDTIVGNLDPSSIKVLGASHDFTWEYTGQGIAAFTFDNILLPDSNTNEAASHGFVTLAVKANKDLAVGDSIYNRAGIYFDFNEPVITNKALTRIATVTSIYTYTNTSLKIYPNPAKDNVRVEWNTKDKATLRLLDVSGKVIQTQMLNQNHTDIDLSKLSKGLYLIQLQTKEGVSTGKLLIQ
jgi:uncharacterized repeat protein (TIGR01451 family)